MGREADGADLQAGPRALLWAFFGVALAFCALLLDRMEAVGALLYRLAWPSAVVLVECGAILGLMAALRALIGRWSPADAAPSTSSRAGDLVVGYPLFGALSYLLGLFAVSAATHGALLAVCAVAGALLHTRAPAAASEPRAEADRRGLGSVGAVALGMLGIALGISVLQAQLPAFSLDELAYHLAVPKAWVIEGRVVPLPLNSQSFYPGGIESADIPFLALLGSRGAIASHLMHVVIAIATCFLVFRWMRERMGTDAALVATLAVASTPALLITAGWSWNEWPLMGICVRLLAGIDAWLRAPASVGRALLLIGVPAAAGLLCKYTFTIFAGIALLMILSAVGRDPVRRRALWWGVGFAVLAGSPFYVRNVVVAGNPIEPFLSGFSPKIAGFRAAAEPRELFLSYVFDPRVADESLGGALLTMALSLSIAWRALQREVAFLVGGFGQLAALVVLALLGPSSRILLPFLAGAGLFGFLALESSFRTLGVRAHRALLASGLVLAGLQLALVASIADGLAPYSTLRGESPDHDFMRSFAGGRTSYSRVRWIDAQLPPDSLTLVVGISQLYYFQHRVRGGGDFDGERMARYLSATGPEALYERLRRDGFTHIAVFRSTLVTPERASKGLRAELETVLEGAAMAAFEAFLRERASLLAVQGDCEVYALR